MLATTPRHSDQLSRHITHRDIIKFYNTFPGAVLHNEDKRATSLRIYCPCLYCQCLASTFFDPAIFRKLTTSPIDTINLTIAKINKRFLKTYPSALGAGRDLAPQCLCPSKRKKQFTSGRPIVSFFTSPFRPMLNCIAKLLYINSFRQPSRTTLFKAMFLTSSKNPGN